MYENNGAVFRSIHDLNAYALGCLDTCLLPDDDGQPAHECVVNSLVVLDWWRKAQSLFHRGAESVIKYHDGRVEEYAKT